MGEAVELDPAGWPVADRRISRRFVRECLDNLPASIQRPLFRRWAAHFREAQGDPLAAGRCRAAANTYLRELAERVAALPVALVPAKHSPEPLAETMAARCRTLAMRLDGEDLWLACMSEVWGCGLDRARGEGGAELARYACQRWWRRRLKALAARETEALARDEGLISRHAQCYVSDAGLAAWREQRAASRRMLEGLELVEIGDDERGARDLLAVVDASVANPENRRAELMTRIAGLERIACRSRHSAMFPTITCPSRFHAVLSRSGERNPRYENETPRAGAAYLGRVWAACRRAMKESGIEVYGLRVREPQHDGTPHDHYLLFGPAADLARVHKIMRREALRESPTERGARRHRYRCEWIDPRKGSAAGYVAKYIAKAVHGAPDDIASALPGSEAGDRVRAWASRWGLRQFAFIGAPPVGWYRMLRALHSSGFSREDRLGAAMGAANAGDFAGYVEAAGGVCLARKDRPLETYRERREGRGRYGEEIGEIPVGVQCGAAVVRCLVRQYVIQRKGGEGGARSDGAMRARAERERTGTSPARCGKPSLAACAPVGAAHRPQSLHLLRARTLAGCGRQNPRRRGAGVGVALVRVVSLCRVRGARRAPWTRVNNCSSEGVGHGRRSGRRYGRERA